MSRSPRDPSRNQPHPPSHPTHPANLSSGDAVAADAGVHLLASQLLADLATETLEPSLVHLAGADDHQAEVGLLPLADRHPTQLLVGFTAPAHWHALGMVTSGWAFPIGARADADRRRSRVHVVTLITRSGEVAHRTEVVDDPSLSSALAIEEPEGEQIDLLRRALGLATEPPPCRTDVYWTVEWLSTLLSFDDIDSWGDVVNAHPAMRMLAPDDDLRATEFAEVVGGFGRVVDWQRLRRLAADGRFTAPELTPTEAAWFDDGSFARFLLNRCPPLAMLRRQVIDHLPGHLAQRLLATLDELGVPRSAWPDDASGRAA